ncbi:MAG: hypothetical protein KFF73_05610 [Cyclobacteriaceae bacterium]|nr:hypothetical protein [Cyclobacteriaceae bacterium]
MKTTIYPPFIKKIGICLFLLSIAGLIFSCAGDKRQEKDAAEEFDQAASELSGQVKKVIYQIPPPSEIPALIQSTGANYNPDLVNSLDKAKKYTASNKVAALNLGVYTTDIGYLVTYEKVQEALNYMEVSLELGESIGIQNAIDPTVVRQFESNLDNKDTLASIINRVIRESDEFLNENERSNIAALIITGTFIEGLYISTQLVDTYPGDMLPEDSRNLVLTPLIRMILNQEEPLNDMIGLLNNIEDKDDWISGLINSMEELKKNYEALDIQDPLSENRTNVVLSDKTLERITLQIRKIRNTVTY